MAKLAAEKEATLRLKGENGIMKKKFSRLSKSVPYHTAKAQSMYRIAHPTATGGLI